MNPVLRTVKSILEDVQYELNDTSASKWPVANLHRAYNRAILKWGVRLNIPALYTGISSWVSGTYDYTLPDWIRPDTIRPQLRRPAYLLDGTSPPESMDDTWADIVNFSVEPLGSGGWNLRLGFSPPSVDARIIHLVNPGRIPYPSGSNYHFVPTTPYVSNTGTSIAIASQFDAARQGWVLAEDTVGLELEWIQYNGLTRAQASTTLLNCVRGLAGTTATTQDANTKLYWGVALEREEDADGLMHSICAAAHRQYLGNTSSQNQNYHQQMVTYHEGAAREAMRYRTTQGSRFHIPAGWLGGF